MKALKSKLKLSGRGAASRVELPSDVVETLQRARSQAIAHIQKMDESDPAVWARIIHLVRQVGLTRETMCRELSCAWSTVLRWGAGQTVPGPFARKAIKERLLELLTAKPKRLVSTARVKVVRSQSLP
jgi:hypothetical protein